MLQHFVQYCFKFLAALNFYRGPRPFALALGFGCFLGLLYGENALLVLLFLALACILPMNHLLMLLSSLFFSILGTLFFAWQLRVGVFLLENNLLFYVFQFLNNLPLLPWLGLNRADNLGALVLGPLAGFFIFGISYKIFLLLRKPKPRPKSKAKLACLEFLEGHVPMLSSLLHMHKLQEWKAEYEKAFQALQLAHQVQEETRQRELDRPDSY